MSGSGDVYSALRNNTAFYENRASSLVLSLVARVSDKIFINNFRPNWEKTSKDTKKPFRTWVPGNVNLIFLDFWNWRVRVYAPYDAEVVYFYVYFWCLEGKDLSLRPPPLSFFPSFPCRPTSHPHQSSRYHSVIGHDHQGPQLNGDPLLENYPVTCWFPPSK